MSTVHEPDAPCDSDAARLLPWFVTGRLAADEAAQVESHLAGCATCRADLEQERELHGRLQDDRAGREGPPSPSSFQKLMARIDETERAMPPRRAQAPRSSRAMRARAPRWLLATVAVQAAGLAVLGTTLWLQAGPRFEPRYQTLTSSPASSEQQGPHLRVVFAPGTTVHDVADLLRGIDARIVDGPSPVGAYALAVTATDAADRAVASTLARLRADERVIFAEPIQERP